MDKRPEEISHHETEPFPKSPGNPIGQCPRGKYNRTLPGRKQILYRGKQLGQLDLHGRRATLHHEQRKKWLFPPLPVCHERERNPADHVREIRRGRLLRVRSGKKTLLLCLSRRITPGKIHLLHRPEGQKEKTHPDQRME